MHIAWATVASGGTPVSGGGYSSIYAVGPNGEYSIGLGFKVDTTPAIVGSQTSSANLDEANTDGVIFPTLSSQGATAQTGNNNGTHMQRSFSFIAAGETGLAEQVPPNLRVLWGVVESDGTCTSCSEGVNVAAVANSPGHYQISFVSNGVPVFGTVPAIVGTQTNQDNLTEANTDGMVFPVLSASSATAVTGSNVSEIEPRSFSFIAVGSSSSAISLKAKVEDQNRILWGTISPDGSVVGGSGGFWVGRQAEGLYVITFPSFPAVPAIVGSQTNSPTLQDNRDGVVFTWVNVNYAVAITGDAKGKHKDRSFSFIAIGQAS